MKLENALKLVFCLFACFVAGSIGSIFTMPAIPTWYASLSKPFFNPPNFIFGPAWTTLYILMAVSAFLVWQKGLSDEKVKDALAWFAVQLALNSFWSIAFFGLRSPIAGLVVIILLWSAILMTILRSSKISELAAWLMVPYILWVSFAAVLNLSILILNA
jgi:benzodiazapine receptor